MGISICQSDFEKSSKVFFPSLKKESGLSRLFIGSYLENSFFLSSRRAPGTLLCLYIKNDVYTMYNYVPIAITCVRQGASTLDQCTSATITAQDGGREGESSVPSILPYQNHYNLLSHPVITSLLFCLICPDLQISI